MKIENMMSQCKHLVIFFFSRFHMILERHLYFLWKLLLCPQMQKSNMQQN